MAAGKIKGLGMGMDALFSQNETEQVKKTLRLSEITPNKSQPRTDFDEDAISSLADSIKQHGVLQPLLVRPMAGGGYQIVAGERRWRAARIAGLTEVPVVIKELDEREAMELALVENLQRENLNPVEEALGYKELMGKFGYTQEQVAKVVGKSRPAVANSLRLLSLDEKTLKMVRDGEISVGHAKILMGIENPELRAELAQKVKKDLLTVRNLEQLVRAKAIQKRPKTNPQKEVFLREVELSLAETTGRKVTVTGKGGRGKLEIEFYSEEDLAAIARTLEKLEKKEQTEQEDD